jgi:hypothetical protein
MVFEETQLTQGPLPEGDKVWSEMERRKLFRVRMRKIVSKFVHQRRTLFQKSTVTMIGPYIELILIVTGALTAIALLQFIAPAPVLSMIYGKAPTDEVGLAVARHWGLLVFLVGALLIYAAFHPQVRSAVMVVAVIEKAALGLGIFSTSLRTRPAAAAIAAGDSLIALIYVLYLAGF